MIVIIDLSYNDKQKKVLLNMIRNQHPLECYST